MRKNHLSETGAYALLLSFALGASSHAAPSSSKEQALDAGTLTIYSGGRVRDSWHITVADPDAQQKLSGASAVVPKLPNAKVSNSIVGVNKSSKTKPNEALTLHWKDTWYANLRVEGGKPLDLRPYIPHGVLAVDLKVDDLAQGGVAFKITCGENCERRVPYVIPGREMAGKGWRKLVFSMSCFVRDGDDFSAVTQPFAVDANGAGKVTIANVQFKKTGTPNASCPDYKTVSVTPDMLNESWSISWWLPRHLKKLEEAKTRCSSPATCEIVFVGDSITEGWEKDGLNVWNKHYQSANALALGFGGDRTENVLWRLQHGAVDGIKPKVAVLMFGTNNTGHRHEDPKLTAAGIKRNIEELQRRLPATKILLLAIFPRDEKAEGKLRKINEQVNQIISGYADGKKIFFLNINDKFLDVNGNLSKDIMPDFLHPNEKGYEIWAEAMQPSLQKLMQPE